MDNGGFKKYIAEAKGTAILVFMGCGSAVFLGASTPGGHLAVAFAFGLAIVAMAYVIGNLSGCHINPAVSLAAFLDKRITGKEFIGYVIMQIIGGICGALLVFVMATITGVDHTGGLGSNAVANAGGIGGALIIEIILTFIFVIVILSVTSDTSKSTIAGVVIGLTLTFVHIIGIPLTGTSVNPARSIGPAIFAGGAALADLWVFIVAPLIGAALAAWVHHLIIKVKK